MGDTTYRAQVIRRPPPSEYQAKVISRPPPTAARPTGIRVLKVIPGKEGRSAEFIDVSKPEKGRRKVLATRTDQVNLREQLFDAFTHDYVPGMGRRKKIRATRAGKKTSVTTPKEKKRVIRVEDKTILASDLAHRMGIKLHELYRRLSELGGEVADPRQDQPLELETAQMLAQEFEYRLEDASFKEEAFLQACKEKEATGERTPRPPVVTVMGHVDHGKTSILDAIRKTRVADGEEGGITQHIGAYEVHLPKGSITFIDTPGHEAFSAMRARGASVTDIVVLVVAADDGIMPQTAEAIHHAQEAKVPIVVAINKCDLPGAQPERVRQALTEYHLVDEKWGGDTIINEVSAKTGQGLEGLLDSLLLQAEMLELRADPCLPASGSIVEARLDRGRGPVATALVRDGTLHKGDVLVVGNTFGRARMMFNDQGEAVNEAGPGRPVQIQGLPQVPMAGDRFDVVPSEREARRIIEHRQEEAGKARAGQSSALSLQDFYERLQGAEKLELKVMIKADVQGSAEAIRDALEKLSTPKVGIKVIHFGVGAISEADVNLAATSKALLIGFNVRPDNNAKKAAQDLSVDIRTYKIIYELLDDIRKAQTGLLPVTRKENVIGRAEVRDLFTVPKIGVVAGVSVTEGKIQRGAMVRLLRDNVEVHQGKMASLKRFKDDVREVPSGMECGIGLENFNDIKRGDIIEAFMVEEIRPSL
ncbi:MAG: translation initiation factor IF-2 [Myxococcales bacterium]|nr:translation initiation factor IF-2 [Myxococcales bacterium]